MRNEIRIVIAEDHHFVREALRNLMAKESSIKLVAEAKNGEEALALIQQHRPDIALLDISMARPDDGFEVARKLRQMNLPVKVMYMTGQDISETMLRAFVVKSLEVGATGFITKASSSDEIIDSIKAVAAGHRYFSGIFTPYLLDVRDRAAAVDQQHPKLNELTEVECRILLQLAEAMTSKEIAAELRLGHRTVENHLNDIRGKLDLKRHHHLMKFAIEHKPELLLLVCAQPRHSSRKSRIH